MQTDDAEKSNRVTAEKHLASIRAGLLSPRHLFAKIQEFTANSPARKQRRFNQEKADGKLVEWTIAADWDRPARSWFCMAHTKSEARAIWKQQHGRAVPHGTIFKRV